MSDYGVTEKGFVLKRMDTILEEVHGELSEGYGVDTRLLRPSFLDVLVTTFCGQIADLWETAQVSLRTVIMPNIRPWRTASTWIMRSSMAESGERRRRKPVILCTVLAGTARLSAPEPS